MGGVFGFHIAGNPAHHRSQLGLVVHLVADRGEDHCGVGPDDGGRRLEEHQGLLRNVVAQLGGVIDVVAPNCHHLGGDDRRQELGVLPGDDRLGRLPSHERSAPIDQDAFAVGDPVGNVVSGLDPNDLHGRGTLAESSPGLLKVSPNG